MVTPRDVFVSIIIPTRNRAELLGCALRAISAQSYQDFEVIVVDDGSDEKTRAQYEKLWPLLDDRFVLHSVSSGSTKGLGPSSTRNIGILLARGEVLAFCDDDDLWTSTEHLQRMSSVFQARPEVDMYIANQVGKSSRGTEIVNWLPKLTDLVDQRAGAKGHAAIVSVDDLCKARRFAHLNIVSVRRRILPTGGAFWERVSYEEDRDFFWRMVDRCDRIYFDPTVIGQHNIPDPGKTNNQSTQHDPVERWLLSTLVCQHIASSVNNRSISKLAQQYEGDLLRHLARHFAGVGRHAAAFSFARRALGARFSFKWSGYITLLACKALFSK